MLPPDFYAKIRMRCAGKITGLSGFRTAFRGKSK
jgi:hypothetical protein